MEVITELSDCPRPTTGTAVTIGQYDGVHLGHRAVIDEVRARADSAGLETAVVTFDRHPASVVRPESAPRLLTDLAHKLELLDEAGVDHTLVVHFDEERATESAGDFVSEVLLGCLDARMVAVGEDFHFGHRRGGDVAFLRERGRTDGFEVVGLGLVSVEGSGPTGDDAQPVSSTAIRQALSTGELDAATAMLGRLHEARGPVERGDQRGRELGFPTANVAVPQEMQLPADGIYAGWYVGPDGLRNPAAISLGRRPTFYERQELSLLEAHLLDFSGDLYGQEARVQFATYLRPELKFDSVDALATQIQRDCDAARDALA